uniref:Tpd52 like 2a n=1 Tax=Pundamilia nyererei TaxID=303518 RepID=A0A3B4G9L8_9CICH
FLNLIQDMRDASTWPLAHLASSEIVSVEGKQEEKAQTEDEIQALRQVLLAKEQYAADIRRQLGMSPLGNIKQSISKGWQEVQTSAPYVRTRDSLSHAGQVTSAAMSSVGVVITRRLAQMRYTHSQFLHSIFIIKEAGFGSSTSLKPEIFNIRSTLYTVEPLSY